MPVRVMVFSAKRSQQGIVLIVSLIFLLILSLLGLSSIQSATLQENMVGNQRDHDMAFQAAEAALRWAEGQAKKGNGIHDEAWAPGSKVNTYALGDSRLSSNPQYHIWHPSGLEGQAGEGDDDTNPKPIYQITAIGYGGSPNSQVILQSWYVPDE
ncbi:MULTISPECIES: pilus assembly protein [unclassified Modicisalibacter]|uniref:pilus assembly PilX family protein n=1 Tax=unclassified Modicisalibacter TaxID=2679913 RepID=UPI001CCFBA1D|nr:MULTISPECIES: pilus assembly protein [unclassified Modicisalibacter]MBZ9558946.1 hypothetical protein [Modicisalibacter sp. R2A 31.J]MBZ9575162.1 hypothetical protein [Modicisalibacter sp. MOD 31.J]